MIELLIVVAIIGILAGIAVPNFINARMKALVARVHADLNSCQTAIEMYRIDHNGYPLYGHPMDHVTAVSGAASLFLPVILTTPISYISRLPYDPFPPQGFDDHGSVTPTDTYKYLHGYDQEYRRQYFSGAHIRYHFRNSFGRDSLVLYEVLSLGPDRTTGHDGVPYDPSNGLYSYGDMFVYGP